LHHPNATKLCCNAISRCAVQQARQDAATLCHETLNLFEKIAGR
jgi:hypothetical protein